MAGWVSKNEGDGFEQVFKFQAYRERISVEKLGLTGKWERNYQTNQMEFRATPAHCDYLLLFEGAAALVDCKSVNSKVFPWSEIKPHQLLQLQRVGAAIASGYVVCFRPLAKVVFFDWRVLGALKKGNSLKVVDGILLGDLTNFSVKPVFNSFTKPIV